MDGGRNPSSNAKASAPGASGDMMRNYLLSLLTLVCLFVADARSEGYGAAGTRIDHVRLEAALETALKSGATAWVAMRQVIDPGWHTYWLNPGDAGLATTLTWNLPKDVTAGSPRCNLSTSGFEIRGLPRARVRQPVRPAF
jgi:hypothetical protein